MFKGLQPILYGGREVWPLIEGGKGVSATNHASSGAWAAAGGIGTVSAVNADSYDPEGRIIPQVYNALTRRERHEELSAKKEGPAREGGGEPGEPKSVLAWCGTNLRQGFGFRRSSQIETHFLGAMRPARAFFWQPSFFARKENPLL